MLARSSRGLPPGGLALLLSEEAAEWIAKRAAEIVLDSLTHRGSLDNASPFLTVPEAADYIRAKPQRVYDLLSSGRLTRHRDGARVLVLRDELAAYVGAANDPRVASALPAVPQGRTGSGVAR